MPPATLPASGVTPQFYDRQRLAALFAELQALLGPASVPVPLEIWRAEVASSWRDRQRSTRTRMSQALREVLDLAPGGTTADLTTDLLARLAARPGAAATTNGILSSVRAAIRFGIARGYVAPSALAGAKFSIRDGGPSRARHHAMTDVGRVLDQLATAASSWEGGRLYALACVYAYTGVRKMEGLHLLVDDVDLERGIVFVFPNGRRLKTPGSEAPVPAPAALVAVLRAWIPRTGSDWLFPRRNRSGPWTGGTMGRRATDRLVEAGRAVGVEGFTPLSLRHSLATHLATHVGLTDRQVQLVLRHTNTRTQRRYVHPDLVGLESLVRGFSYGDSGR